MSNEKKIRDLMARLVSMSPEPPPFPEETTMAQHREPKRTRPLLVFAGAAALVIALAVPLLLFTGGGEPEPIATTTTTTTPATSTTNAVVTTTTVPGTTTTTLESTTTVPVSSMWTGTVFLFQSPESSFRGNPALVPVTLQLTDTSGSLGAEAQFTDALAVLGSELPELVADAGLMNAIPSEVRIVSLSTEAIDGTDVWVADMNEAFLAGAGGLLADFTMLNQLIYTITWGEGTDAGVLFTVNGEPVTAFGSEGLGLTEPVYRDTFQEELAPIFLTEPLLRLGPSYQVTGMANVFEAMLAVQVLDGSGEVVHEEPVMATCGSGCWGSFTVEIDPTLITPGESSIRLLTHSAEDGSAIDVITVPIPAGDVWAITVES